MAKYLISSDVNGQYDILESNSRWILASGVTIDSSTHLGIYEMSPFSNNSFLIKGTVTAASGTAISLAGTGDDLTISKTGLVKGEAGVSLRGNDQTLVNHGRIEGGLALGSGRYDITNTGTIKDDGIAVGWTGSNVDFTNNGRIDAHYGVGIIDSGSTLSLGENSVIKAKYGVSRYNDAGVSSKTVNEGTISATTLAFSGSEGKERLVNHGSISGEIRLYEGNDVFDTRGGSFTGSVAGGDGDDVFYVNSSKIAVVEYVNSPDSFDIVNTTVSYRLGAAYAVERLVLLGKKAIDGTGDAGDNEILGNSAANRLSGLAGRDELSGGGGRDVFVFATGFGRDVIVDFRDGVDRIDLSDLDKVGSFSQLKSGHLSYADGDATIKVGTDVLTIEDVARGALDTGDFLF